MRNSAILPISRRGWRITRRGRRRVGSGRCSLVAGRRWLIGLRGSRRIPGRRRRDIGRLRIGGIGRRRLHRRHIVRRRALLDIRLGGIRIVGPLRHLAYILIGPIQLAAGIERRRVLGAKIVLALVRRGALVIAGQAVVDGSRRKAPPGRTGESRNGWLACGCL